MKKVVILGASGLVGSFLVKDLCNSDEISSVLSIGRKSIKYDHPKLDERLGDLLDEAFWDFKVEVDIVYICIGTTKAKTPDESRYRAIDFGIPVNATKWAIAQGGTLVSVVSSMGASPKSSNFYLRTKGEMEEAIQKMAIESHIFRPSMILGPRKEKRLGERIGKVVMNFLKPLIPANYKPVEAKDIAAKMMQESMLRPESQLILSKEISD